MNNQSPTLTLPFKHWPEPDRVRWLQSRICNAPFGIQSPAATWSPARVRMVEDAYGQWLAWFEARGELDVELAERVTVDRVEAYVGAMRKRIAPVSVAMMVGNLGRMMAVIYPGKDWAWLRNIYQYLKVNAVPVRDKRQSIVPALDLYNLGLDLMQHADKIKHHTFFNAAIYRDGLIISLLAASALRLANLSSITIGTQLTCHDGEYWLHFPEEETKNSRPIDLVLPNSLVPYIEQYLQHHRRVLLDRRIDKTVAPPCRLADGSERYTCANQKSHGARIRASSMASSISRLRRDLLGDREAQYRDTVRRPLGTRQLRHDGEILHSSGITRE